MIFLKKMSHDNKMAEGDFGGSESQNGKKDDSQDHDDAVQELQDMTLNPNINIETLVEEASNEYENLNKTLDEIDSWMTMLESRNDSLYSQLQELLQSSRETRQELKKMNESQETESGRSMDESKTGDKKDSTNT